MFLTTAVTFVLFGDVDDAIERLQRSVLAKTAQQHRENATSPESVRKVLEFREIAQIYRCFPAKVVLPHYSLAEEPIFRVDSQRMDESIRCGGPE